MSASKVWSIPRGKVETICLKPGAQVTLTQRGFLGGIKRIVIVKAIPASGKDKP